MPAPKRISAMKTSSVAVLAFAVALPAAAQQIGPVVQSDLNGDGRVERFYLLDTGDGTVDLLIENTGGGVIFAENIAWLGGIGQQPELDVAANGSVRLTSMNEAIGRNRWSQTLTIAFRQGTYRVAGFTYAWRDTLDLDAWGSCDLNLLNGRGILEKAVGTKDVRTSFPALPVTEWRETTPIPDACELN